MQVSYRIRELIEMLVLWVLARVAPQYLDEDEPSYRADREDSGQ